MLDYSLFYRRSVEYAKISTELPAFDLLISAYNPTERVTGVFTGIRARRKVWLIHPEYAFSPIDHPEGGESVVANNRDEIAQVRDLLEATGPLSDLDVCVDITGMMRHVLVFLVAKLAFLGIRRFTAVYSEPKYYSQHENTVFSATTSGVVRPVRGMAGSNHASAPEFLIVAVGYDHKMISEVTNNKDGAIVFPLFAFPSLSPDMYQQSALRASEAGSVALEDTWTTNRRFAPANDPFSTAAVLRDIVAEIDRRHPLSNIYLCPLSTKSQALGFALFWQLEARRRGATTMLLPECLAYTRETSVGVHRVWSYEIEFPTI